MLHIFSRTIAVSLLAIFTTAAAQAASIDCADASTADETAVCNSSALSQLDAEMASLWFTYEKIPFLMGGSAARADEARAFLEKRSECGSDEECLRSAYEARIDTLKQGIENWIKSTAGTNSLPQWSSDALPAAVQEITASYNEMCVGLAGTMKPGADRPLVMTADLDGDAVQDFVLNPQNLQCSAAATAFCGNGGCQILLALSHNDYADPVEILGGAPSLRQGSEQGTVLDVWVDKVNCGDTGPTEECLASYVWQDGKLSVTHTGRTSGN